MEKNYRITIFTTENVIEKDYYYKETAFGTIMAYRERMDDFKAGILSEKIEGKWITICSIVK